MDDQRTRGQLLKELDSLREKARQFDTLMGNLNGMVYRCLNNADWTMTYVNGGVRALTGYAPDDLLGNRTVAYGDLICPQDRETVWNSIQQAIDTGAHFTLQYRICDAGGAEKWVWEQGCSVSDDAGVVIALEGFITDMTTLKQTEQTLMEREETYRNYIEHAPQGIFVVNGEGRHIEANHAASRMTGYTRDEILSMHITDFSIEPDGENAREQFASFISEGTQPGVAPFKKKDGSVGWWSVEVVRISDNRFIGFTTDVTELNRLDGELRKREADLRRAQEVAHVGSWEFDFATREVHASEEARRIYGLPDHVVTIPDVQKIPLPEYRTMLDRAIRKLREQGAAYDVEFQIERPTDGAVIDIHSVAQYDGERDTVYGTIQDITARKQTERDLRESETRYRLLADNTLDVIWMMNLDTRFTYVNQSITAMFGFTPEEWTGTYLADHCDSEQMAMMQGIIEHEMSHLDTHEGIIFETVMNHRDGTPKWVEIHGTFLLDEEGRPTGLQGTTRDIGERKQAEERLKKSEATFSTFMNNLPGFAYIKDEKRRHLFVNKALEKMYGAGPDGWRGKTFEDLLPVPEAAAIRENDETMIRSKSPIHFEEKALVDGEPRTFLSVKFPIQIPDGSIYLGGISMDITERKQAELDLLAARQRLRVFIDASTDLYFLKDTELRYQLVNKANAEFFGLEEKDIIGKTDYELMDRDAAERCVRSDHEALNDQKTVTSTERVGDRMYETRKFPVVIDGTIAGVSGIIRDVTESTRAAEEIRNRERLLQKIYDILPIGLWLADKDGNLVMGNAAGAAIWGAEPHVGMEEYGIFKARRLPSGEEIAPDDWALVHTIKEGAAILDEMLEIDTFDGRKKIILNYSTPIFDDQGTVEAAIVVNQDITERTRAEQEVKASEERYRTYISNIHDVIVILDPDLTIKYQSPNITSHFGWQPGELTGHDGWETVHPDDKKYIAQELEELLSREGNTGTVRYRFRCKDGSYTYVELFAVNMINDPVIGGILSNFHDITEQRAAEMTIRESEEKFRLAFKTSPDAVNINKLDGTYVDINNGFTRLTGYTEADVLGKTSTEIDIWAKPEDRRKLVAGLNKQGSVANLQSDFRCKDGSIKTAIMSASIIMINHEPHILSITRDISDRIRLEEQLRQAQKMEAIGRLAGGVAHDFNNMLNVILGNAEIILSSIEKNSELYEDIQEIIKAGQRSAGLTRQLLAFSRKQIISPKILNINKIIVEQKQMLVRLIGEDIQIVTNLAEDLWSVRIDPSQIDQILANLLVNARDAIAGVGTVTIETANVNIDHTYDEIDAPVDSSEFVMLSCIDSGAGMEDDVLKRIFEPFFTTKGEGQGTGLGLSTVYGIVKQNNGVINVYSEPGMGSVFRIYFPRSASETKAETTVKREQLQGGTETVLIVEDEPQILNLAKKVLTRYGYTVLASTSTSEAIAQVQAYEDTIHLLLTDVVMPAMNGKELQAAIEALKPAIRTLYMSGYTADVIAHRGIIDDGVEFIQKPFSTVELVKKVRYVLDM